MADVVEFMLQCYMNVAHCISAAAVHMKSEYIYIWLHLVQMIFYEPPHFTANILSVAIQFEAFCSFAFCIVTYLEIMSDTKIVHSFTLRTN